MIKSSFQSSISKMMLNLLVLSLCCVASRASGEFSVLSSPKSISFKGNDVLQSQYVGDVLYAALGNPVAGDAKWEGMTVNDPFNMAKGVIALFVDGVEHINVNADAKTYEMTGSAAEESLNAVSAELEASYAPVCDINFQQFDEAVNTYRACFGDLDVATKISKHLNPSLHNADKLFINAIAYIEAAAENLAKMAKASKFLVLRVPLSAVAKAHGEKSDAMAEAIKLIASTVTKLNAAVTKSSNNEAFVVAISNKSLGSRAKREVVPPSTNGKNQYNLAEYYNQDYPVIFNIILWFMVTFGLALLAICYAIGSMDPGRDSIIYRMTANRMKKDN